MCRIVVFYSEYYAIRLQRYNNFSKKTIAHLFL